MCFAGRVGEFLRCNTFLVPDSITIKYLEQLERLDEDERSLLFYLSTKTDPVEFSELARTGKSQSTLMKAVARLVEMQWLERQEVKHKSGSVVVFVLSPFIRKIVLAHPGRSIS